MRKALLGWCAIGAVVVAFDAHALSTQTPTLSKGFWAAVRHPHWRWLVAPTWLTLTVHLFFGVP